MNIIQSSWACNQPDLLTSNSGWLAPEYNLMSWTLSCLQLKQYYPNVILYCEGLRRKRVGRPSRMRRLASKPGINILPLKRRRKPPPLMK